MDRTGHLGERPRRRKRVSRDNEGSPIMGTTEGRGGRTEVEAETETEIEIDKKTESFL